MLDKKRAPSVCLEEVLDRGAPPMWNKFAIKGVKWLHENGWEENEDMEGGIVLGEDDEPMPQIT
jgi:hypothetical protein